MTEPDPRLTAARGDIAALHLSGQVVSRRYVEGSRFQVAAAHSALRRTADAASEQVNQALFGETFMAYDQSHGWAWGQMENDGYVGWMALASLTPEVVAATHRVRALRTFVFERPDLKSVPMMALSMNAKLTPGDSVQGFRKLARSGWVFAGHVGSLGEVEPDFVRVAERFTGSPYLWGGRDSIGLDCSGLVQAALEAAGVEALRDSDMQERSLGVEIAPDLTDLKRGDLVFWPGHVAIMLDATRVIHANAWHMAVEVEDLAGAVARIRLAGGEVRCVRRLG
ncbi:MAG: NlpC/P60 family protein [Alphaproteobacteria bacterium]|nr:NlpC/P60 family protein [Alphaproteobacteria bacterium]